MPFFLNGPAGTAHFIRQELIESRTCVGAWFLHLPGAHPVWEHYLLSVASLREEPGAPPPERHYPGAEYELVIYALKKDARPYPDRPDSWHPLVPPNIVFQFGGTGDEGAADLARIVVPRIVRGELWVEHQGIRGEHARWQSYLLGAVEALRAAQR